MTDKKETENKDKLVKTAGDAVRKQDKNESLAKSMDAVKQTVAPKETADLNDSTKLFNAKSVPKMAAKKNSRSGIMPYFIALLLILALFFTGWNTYQQTLVQENWNQLQAKVSRQIEQQTQTIQQLKTSTELSLQTVNRTQLQLNQLSSDNQSFKESLLSTQERIRSLSGRQKQDWMLAEAAYLIKVAQLQLSLQKDKTTAIQLLKSADALILEIADSSLLPIRQAIAKDISNISLIIEVDLTGASLALNAISQQIPRLEIAALELAGLNNSIPDSAKTDSGSFDLSQFYHQFLEDFIEVKDHSEPVKPLMTPSQRANLNSNIQLAIQQAQIALAMGNEALYRMNLNNAILWSKDFFSQNDKTQQVIKQLEQQRNVIVDTRYPDKLKAKLALEAISRQQLYRWLDASVSVVAPSQRTLTEITLPKASTGSVVNKQEAILGETDSQEVNPDPSKEEPMERNNFSEETIEPPQQNKPALSDKELEKPSESQQ